MRRSRNPFPLRRVSTALLGAVLVTIAVFAVHRSRVLQEEEGREEAARSRAELSTIVNLWEGLVTDRITTWLVDLPDAADLVIREQQVRAKVPWFDAFYQWERTAEGPRFIYPAPSPEEDLQALLATPCMRVAHSLAVTGAHEQAATAFLGCTEGSDAERLLASNMAARQRYMAGQPADAWMALSQVDPAIRYPLNKAAMRGLSVRRLVTRRLLAADILGDLGHDARRIALLGDTFVEITNLSGPDLEALLPTAERLHRVELAQALDTERLSALEARLARARRRLAGYQEIRERLSKLEQTQTTPTGPALPGDLGRMRVVHDMYSDPGFILVWAPLGDTGEVAAVHLDAEALLNNLLKAEGDPTAEQRIAVLDASGQPVRKGVELDPETRIVADVPLGWLFPHLRLAMLTTSDAALRRAAWSTVVQLMPMAIAIMLGVVAIAVHVAANRRERDLFERQQAFIARVTHELKTPLAGIRVMAETLQMGAAHDPSTSKKFLERIIQETEKLGQRIDEVLTAARTPQVSEVTPIKPEELAAEVVETWRPRFAQAGAVLETDLKPCAPIPADPPLLRDALGNLLDNALKYQKPGVRGRCLVRTGEVGRWVIFEVTDNGIGVPPAMRRRIFERFTRVEGPGRGKAGGHGLGLSFVAEAAAAHNGVVECTEGFDGGARFRLKLRRGR